MPFKPMDEKIDPIEAEAAQVPTPPPPQKFRLFCPINLTCLGNQRPVCLAGILVLILAVIIAIILGVVIPISLK